jgi:hypothetical protein
VTLCSDVGYQRFRRSCCLHFHHTTSLYGVTTQKTTTSNYINADNLQNLRGETSRKINNRKREYLKDKINELETNNKNKNIRHLYRGINEFKKGHQPRINIIKDENGNVLPGPQCVLNRWKNFFNQLLNVHEFMMLGRWIYIRLSH